MKFTILVIYKCTVQQHQGRAHCRAAIAIIHLQNLFIF